MSIIASVKVHDAIVLGSDSMTTISGLDEAGQTVVVQNYHHAQKVHQLSPNIGVGTSGVGNVGPRSINSVIEQFARQEQENLGRMTLANAAGALLQHFCGAYAELDIEAPELGALIGGYGPDDELAEVWEFNLARDKEPQLVNEGTTFGASWRGISLPFTRIYQGIDPRLTAKLQELTEEDITPLVEEVRCTFVFDGMPVQDAVDLVVFMLRTTINIAKFEPGSPSCGGPLWVAAITKKDGFRWIQKPSLVVREEDHDA